MKVVLVALSLHGHCMNIPAIAWKFPTVTVLDYAKNTYGATPSQLAYLKWCILRPRPGG